MKKPIEAGYSPATRLLGWCGVALSLGWVMVGVAGAQVQGAPPPTTQGTEESVLPEPAADAIPNLPPDMVTPAAPTNYLIGSDDLLYVYVYQMPEFTRQVRVDDDGQIQLPYLRSGVPAAGETAIVVEQRIATELAGSGLANHPLVSVTVRQVMSEPIVVAGAVRQPLTIQAARPMTLLELIARAGGLSTDPPAGMTAIITHNRPDLGITSRVDISQLLQGDSPWQTTPIYGGATALILPASLVYAVGAFEKPGAFPIRVGEPVTTLKVIALAEGIKDPASRSHAEIIRPMQDGSRQIFPVNLDRVLKHKSSDPVMQAGDILYLPVNGRAKTLDAILADAGQAAVIAIGYGKGF